MRTIFTHKNTCAGHIVVRYGRGKVEDYTVRNGRRVQLYVEHHNHMVRANRHNDIRDTTYRLQQRGVIA